MLNRFNFTKPGFLYFVGGALFSTVAVNFAKSKCCKNMCINAVAQCMKMKDDTEHAIAVVKEEAEDLYNEAKLSSGKNHNCCCHSEQDEE